MKARIELENVGGIAGKHAFDIVSGSLNIIEAQNQQGKSTLLKAIAAIYSLPAKSDLALEIASRFGLKSASEKDPEPLVNIGSDKAIINLSLDGETRKCTIEKYGDVFVKPEGDDRFLLTSILTDKSELVRKLQSGERNLEWILRLVSLKTQYEREKFVLEELLRETEGRINDISEKKNKIKSSRDELNLLKSDKEKTEKRIKEIDDKINSLPSVDPKLDKKYKSLLLELDERREKVDRVEKPLREAEKGIKSAEKRKKEADDLLIAFQEELRSLPSDDEIKNQEKNDLEKYTQIPELNIRRERILGKFDVYKSALKSLEEGEAECPLCETGVITRKALEPKIDQVKGDLRKVDNEISKISAEHDNFIKKINQIKPKKKTLERTIASQKATASDIEQEIELSAQRLEVKQKEWAVAKKEHDNVKDKVKEIENLLKISDSGKGALIEELGRFRQKLDVLDTQIDLNEKEISEKFSEEVLGSRIPLDEATQIYESWKNLLGSLIIAIDEKIIEQKKGFAKRFNDKTRELLNNIVLKEFDEISVDDETNIIIKRKGKTQSITSLSSSELNSLITLLQVALKETYSPEVPFFLIDEIMLDFDRETVTKILGYMLKVAKEKEWFIVLAKLGKGQLQIKQINSLENIENI